MISQGAVSKDKQQEEFGLHNASNNPKSMVDSKLTICDALMRIIQATVIKVRHRHYSHYSPEDEDNPTGLYAPETYFLMKTFRPLTNNIEYPEQTS